MHMMCQETHLLLTLFPFLRDFLLGGAPSSTSLACFSFFLSSKPSATRSLPSFKHNNKQHPVNQESLWGWNFPIFSEHSFFTLPTHSSLLSLFSNRSGKVENSLTQSPLMSKIHWILLWSPQKMRKLNGLSTCSMASHQKTRRRWKKEGLLSKWHSPQPRSSLPALPPPSLLPSSFTHKTRYWPWSWHTGDLSGS